MSSGAAFISDSALLSFESLTVDVSAVGSNGRYKLAGNAREFVCAVTVQDSAGYQLMEVGDSWIGSDGYYELLISGGGGSDGLESAIDAGADLLITGEFDHTMYHMVQENKIHVAALGHYNSEVHGVQSLQKLAAEVLGLETVFIDIPTGL